MLRLLADENFNNHILHGIRRQMPSIELERVQDCYLMSADDDTVLEWAATHDYVVIAHDRRTVPPRASERVRQGLAMTGVIVIPSSMPTGLAIEELGLLACCYERAEMENNIIHLPL